MPIGSSWPRTRLISVVFPAPEGPETMKRVPSGWKLLDILYLLADPLDLGFQFYNDGSQRRGARLRAHRVDLAQHLLREEVELLAGRLFLIDHLGDLLDVVRQPRDLLGDVAALDHHHHFLGDALLGNFDAGLLRDLVHAVAERGQELAADVVAQRRHLRLQLADRLQTRGDVGAQRLALTRAHGAELRARLAHEGRQRVALLVGDLEIDGVDLEEVGQAEQIAAAERAAEAELLGDRAELRDHVVRDRRVDAHRVLRLLRALHADGDVELPAREGLRGDRAPERLELPKVLGKAHRGLEEAVVDGFRRDGDVEARRERAGGEIRQ